ncbi:hypothetical protein [Mesorhizobium loti]|uniref:Uncharacterized protein n=1 Tax=Mesorhizobium loti R88b TaxID=935548 RepID=A0A6M7WMW4_RHILI|nr:hypothetical protein [Mesorhizobium loti]QKD03467.1 hypothetical protein EB235_19785 [Mesorhizobium loti R88b]
MSDNNILPKNYFDERPPKSSWPTVPKSGIITIAAVIVAIAGIIYIAQFAWSFKVAADQRQIARHNAAQRIIHNELAKLCSPADRISDPDTCRLIPE